MKFLLKCRRLPPEKIVQTLGLAIGRVLDFEPALAILTIHSGLALRHNPLKVAGANFSEKALPVLLDVLSVKQA
jgi:hypothetical protein